MTKWVITILMGLALLSAAVVGGYWMGRAGTTHARSDPAAAQSGNGGSGPSAPRQGPVVPVRIVKARRRKIQETITAYGTVLSEPGAANVVSVPYESRISRGLVTPGQKVSAGTPLLVVGPSPNAKLQLIQAKNALAAANRNLVQVRNKFKEQLATNAQLSQAQQARQQASTRLASMRQRGVAGSRTLRAQVAGVVGQVQVRSGQIVAPGSALAEVVPEHRIEVKLGVEPEDIPYLKAGQPIHLTEVHAPTSRTINGHIRLITKEVDPQTRLVNVFVALPPGSDLILQDFVRGRITTASKKTLVVPREAVLLQHGKAVVFTADHGQAVRHTVSLGLENDRQVEIRGSGVVVGDQIVVVGNYELKNGMAVKVGGRS